MLTKLVAHWQTHTQFTSCESDYSHFKQGVSVLKCYKHTLIAYICRPVDVHGWNYLRVRALHYLSLWGPLPVAARSFGLTSQIKVSASALHPSTFREEKVAHTNIDLCIGDHRQTTCWNTHLDVRVHTRTWAERLFALSGIFSLTNELMASSLRRLVE